MSGSTIGGVIGGIIGAYFGNAQLGWAIGSAIGGAIDPEEIKGPSIGDAQRQTSQAGVPRPVVYGHPAPFMGNLIDGEKKARKIEQTEGGKGGGPEVTTERFILTSAIRICEGPIAGVLKIWRNDQLVYDRTNYFDFPDWAGATVQERNAYIAGIRAKSIAMNGRLAIYLGTEDQLPDPTLEAIHGVGNTPYYRGTAYIVIKDDDVTDMRGAAAQWKFEVLSAATEGDVPEVTPDVDPLPKSGYSASSPTITMSTSPIVPAVQGALLARIHAQNRDATVTYVGRPRAPRAGLADSLRFCPGRVVLTDSAGTIYFDSGWMGDPIQQTDLDEALVGAGMPPAQITPIDQVVDITFPSTLTPLTATFYVAGFGLVFPTVGSGSPQIEIRYPDPALLPDYYTTSPEVPNTLLGGDGELYYPSWVTPPTMTTLTPGAVYVAPTIADIAERCNVPATSIDVTPLVADELPGLLVALQGTGSDCIRPLQQGYFFDMPEYDAKLRAIKRGAPPAFELTDDDLLDVDLDEDLTRPQAVEFPRLVSVITQDPDANYAPVPQTVMRTSVDVKPTSEIQVSLAIPFGADKSKQIAEKLLKVMWAQAEGRTKLPLPEKFSTLVASDCFTFANRRWLVEKTDYADGEMRVQAVYDRGDAYESIAVGQPAVPPALPSSGLGGPTILHFLNTPILTDLDDRPGFYVGVTGVLDGWKGATITGRVRETDPWTVLATVTARTVAGSLVTALANAPFDVVDRTNTVRVLVNGDLSSITEEQLLNELNGCVIGDEVCQFQTAAFVSAGVYDLSILTRGRLNTPTASHAVGDRFVLLNAPTFIEVPTTWIGQALQLRAVTLGTIADNNPTTNVVWSPARSQTEWPPVQFVGARDSSNNVSISWVGQGRLGSNKLARNSQHFDNYRLTITKGTASVVYTTTSQSFAYSAAQQTTDFGSATGTLSVSIAAMNRITGASAALTGSIP